MYETGIDALFAIQRHERMFVLEDVSLRVSFWWSRRLDSKSRRVLRVDLTQYWEALFASFLRKINFNLVRIIFNEGGV